MNLAAFILILGLAVLAGMAVALLALAKTGNRPGVLSKDWQPPSPHKKLFQD